MNYLIGSSNIYRFYKPEAFKDKRMYKMVKCTKIESFMATMLEFDEGNVVISIFENLIVDAAGKETGDKRTEAWAGVVTKVLEVIKTEATRRPNSKWSVVMPLMRPAIEWYQASLDQINVHIKKELDKDNLINVTMINSPPPSAQVFEKDGVHLDNATGNAFLNLVLEASEDFF